MANTDGGELKLTEPDLRQWELLARFRQRLDRLCRSQAGLHASWSDPRRQLQLADYLSLFLFGLLNPALKTVQALCSASQLARVRREVCGQSVSLGSFSEAQHLCDPELLQRVFGELVGQVQGATVPDRRQQWQQWFARDSSLFAALPRMSWALYGGGRAGAANRAVRLHLNFELGAGTPVAAQVTPGKACERRVWEAHLEAGAAYVGDRYFGEDYRLLRRLEQKRCRYVLRLRDQAVIQVVEELPVSPVEQARGVQRQAWARLGARADWQSPPVRVVWLAGVGGEQLRLVTNVKPEALNAAEIGLLYRRRWQIECFFRWVKCLLGCRHWLAESQRGVTLQLYLALIAAVLLQWRTGQRPNRRMFELIQMYLLGWASLDELLSGLSRQLEQAQARKKKQ